MIFKMNIESEIRKRSTQPISHQVVGSLLKYYHNRNDKVHRLIKNGILLPVRKGLYIAGPSIEGAKPEPILLANHITGPSYVTAETALSYYGLIPERVYATVSATVKPGRTFQTPAGVFAYHRLPLPYYSFGIERLRLGDDQYALMASPIKAIFDKIVLTPGLTIRSRTKATHLLIDDLRMDEDAVKRIVRTDVEHWLPEAPKHASLAFILEAMEEL